ncbi:MAG TPA: glycosyltransferase [Steroidobacteraceae bacterium]|jgi:spore maturation protein CgeB|nr:glycosyltransferase [Steroidobacteraceae bacterium]
MPHGLRFVFFAHSLISDWNHGNAHFLRGVVSELLSLGHEARVLEPLRGWSLQNLRRERGDCAVDAFNQAFPRLRSTFYDPATLDLGRALEGADVVIVHEWNPPELIARLGRQRALTGGFKLLFHDTHHRIVSAPQEMRALDLSNYDGVLAFGEALRRRYQQLERVPRAWVWHEAADTGVFRPVPGLEQPLDLVWVGNWGDGERSRELMEYLIEPVRDLGLRARIYGVRYPAEATRALGEAGIEYGGWVANFRVPALFACSRVTVHVPRRFYREQLPGIPTIRMFEALACRMPLVTAPWEDSEKLFTPGRDYLVARDGAEMRQHLGRLLRDPGFAQQIAEHGYRTVLRRHTCAHRVQELLGICRELGVTELSHVA